MVCAGLAGAGSVVPANPALALPSRFRVLRGLHTNIAPWTVSNRPERGISPGSVREVLQNRLRSEAVMAGW